MHEQQLLAPSMVFSTIDMDQLGKIRQRLWKKRLKMSYNCQVWKWYVLCEQRCRSTKLRKLTDVCMVERKFLPPPYTNICKILQLWGAYIFVSFQHLTFPAELMDFL